MQKYGTRFIMENPASRESVVVGCCLMIGTSDRGPAPIENPFRSRLHKFGVKPRREITRPTVKSQRRHTIIKYFGKQTRPLCHCAVTDTVAMRCLPGNRYFTNFKFDGIVHCMFPILNMMIKLVNIPPTAGVSDIAVIGRTINSGCQNNEQQQQRDNTQVSSLCSRRLLIDKEKCHC